MQIRRTVVRLVTGFALGCALLGVSSRAAAGPIEVLASMSINPSDSKVFALRYQYWYGGIYITDDGGKTLRMLCGTAADPSVQSDGQTALVQIMSDGTIALGDFTGMRRGDVHGCGWQDVPEFKGQWVKTIVIDPIDPTITYAVTSSGGKSNSIYKRVGTNQTWKAIGTSEEILIGSLSVAAMPNDKRRFYEVILRGEHMATDPITGDPISRPNYLTRYSDDDGATWKEHDYGDTDADAVTIAAIDPTDPERLLIWVRRGVGGGLDSQDDDVVIREKAGEGPVQMIGVARDFGGAAFLPDGTLFYGNRHQDTPALFKVAPHGLKPVTLNEGLRAGCVTYDPKVKKLYVCPDQKFGTVDMKTGVFTQTFDIRQTSQFVDCPGEDSVANRCEMQLMGPGFCDPTHYPCTPICVDTYHFTDCEDAGVSGAGGASGTGAAGAAGTGAAGSAGGNAGTTGAAGTAADGGMKSNKKSSSCSVVQAPGTRDPQTSGAWSLLAACLACASVWRVRRRATSR